MIIFSIPSLWSINLRLMLNDFLPYSIASHNIDNFICLIDCYMHHMLWNIYRVILIVPTLPKVSDQELINHWGVMLSRLNPLNAFGASDEFKICVWCLLGWVVSYLFCGGGSNVSASMIHYIYIYIYIYIFFFFFFFFLTVYVFLVNF